MIELLELEKLYEITKREYDIAYRELNVNKSLKMNNYLIGILVISIIINIMTFIAIIQK